MANFRVAVTARVRDGDTSYFRINCWRALAAGQRQQGRQSWRHEQRQQHRPPPGSANGHRPSATTDDLARIRRIIAALLRKAAACREKAEALRAKYGL